MEPNRRQRAEELFASAAGLPREVQERFLDENCSDAAVRVEVERLLEYDAAHGGGLTEDVLPGAAVRDASVRAPGRGDLSRDARRGASSGRTSSSGFDHGRFVPGEVLLERYRIVGLLGTGGMGEVYRADDLELGQSVALKFLPDRLSKDPRALERFRNEVRLARQVSHPNVCRVYDIGQVEGDWFLTMEYVDGEDLAQLLQRIGRFPADRATTVARQLCMGLEAAHEKGVLHRDLKPANVMVDGRGKVLITDFGLADLADSVDADDVRSGTPAYMAPEQLVGREVTRQSDIYALGLVLHEVFTGKAVWEADTLAELYRKRQESGDRAPSSGSAEALDPAIERVIQSCLEADPRNRPRSALAVAAALPGGDPLAAALAAGETPSPELVAASGGSGGLHPAIALGLLAVIVLGMLLPVFLRPAKFRLTSKIPVRPEFLVRDAQALLESLGWRDPASPPGGEAYGFDAEQAQVSLTTRFWYREAPEPLVPENPLEPLVDPDDPAPVRPGMATVILDAMGALKELRVVPPELDAPLPAERPGGPLDRERALASSDPTTELIARLAEVARLGDLEPLDAPPRVPPVFADQVLAWRASRIEGDSEPSIVTFAAFRGRPVWFRVDPPSGDSSSASRQAAQTYDTMTGLTFVLLTLLSAPLARRNLLRGRSDRRGAFRLALFSFSTALVSRLLAMDHVPEFGGEFLLLTAALIMSTWIGIVMWLFYIALEPLVRRWCPQALITWSRVLAGRFRDPSVGRDVLIGGAFCVAWLGLGTLKSHLDVEFGLQPRSSAPMALQSFEGGRHLNALIIFVVAKAVGDAIFFLVMLLLLQLLFRRRWLAIVVFGLVWSLMWCYGRPATAWILAPAVFLSIGFLQTRFGLLPCIAALFFLYTYITIPIEFGTTSWTWSVSFYGLSVVVVTACWAAWTATGRQFFAVADRPARE